MAEKVAYLVHDLTDAAVRRRIAMFRLAGAAVSVAGFSRSSLPASEFSQASLDLGRTADARLVSRVISVARRLTRIAPLKETVAGADIVVARNLEMLAIASRARARFAPDASLVYECLDIHRLLLSNGLAGKFLRAMETVLWRDTDVLLTSSPAFVQHYFLRRGFPGVIQIIENKVLEAETTGNMEYLSPAEQPGGPPWKIGWFGMLRCSRSLRILKELAKAADGKIEVVIRGKFSPAIFPNIQDELGEAPHVRYLGPYNGDADLMRIYREVHFSWAIDFYEESQNSSWLLPNRLYESSHAGAVPIALDYVETGHWLKKHRAGATISDPLEDNLRQFFSGLDSAAYRKLAAQIQQIPRYALTSGAEDCRRLLALLVPKQSSHACEKASLNAIEEAK